MERGTRAATHPRDRFQLLKSAASDWVDDGAMSGKAR